MKNKKLNVLLATNLKVFKNLLDSDMGDYELNFVINLSSIQI